jgi:hypothetical protein
MLLEFEEPRVPNPRPVYINTDHVTYIEEDGEHAGRLLARFIWLAATQFPTWLPRSLSKVAYS